MSWPLVKLDSVVEVLSGFAFKSSSFNKTSQGVPIIRIQNVAENNSEEDFVYWDESYKEKFLIDDGDILLSLSGNIKLGIWGNGKALLNQRIIKISEKEGLDKGYLFYFLMSAVKSIAALGKEAVISNVSVNDFKALLIPIPPLETQKQIAAVLEKADQLRKDCQQMEQELNSLAQSVFIDMFGDPVTNPKGWDIALLSSLGIVKGGLQVTSKRSVNPISVPYLRVANVYRDYLKLDEVKEIRVTSKELERVLLEKGDVLFVEGHGNANEVGRTAVWNNEIDQCVHQNHLIRFRAGDEVRPEYVSAFVNSASGRRQLVKMSKTTSGLNTLSTSNINSIQITVPPLAQQDKYLSFMSGLLKQKGANSELNTELDDQFNALMQKAFKGDLNL
ncbi:MULTISPECIES: restriction endonuclease subunit S [Vibrio]|uniref:restriction endonuclease subunit S n=1 Tax=Vibrio TaxID=662 RepID=UPI00137889CE|nr:restriction endonuclease subunit S [Vibrio toranzoniae]NAZ71016.1 restriction endonuclease subunit S [Vibrio toranzoniae]